MIHLNSNQMVIDRAEYKRLKAIEDSWVAMQTAKTPVAQPHVETDAVGTTKPKVTVSKKTGGN